jgi:hypothetical protein
VSEQEVAKTAVTEETAETSKRLPDIAYTIYLGQFQQISVLAVALAGGALVMHQVGLFNRPWNGPLGAIFFSVSALLAAIAPLELTEGIVENKDVRKAMKRYAMASLLFLGMGTGAVVMGLIRAALK